MTAPGNASKITDIPLVKTRVVTGWIPASVLFPGVGGCAGGGRGQCGESALLQANTHRL